MSNAESLIKAELVYDGSDVVTVPSSMDMPALNQMQGTDHERLGELASRTCYDSLGVDRSTGKVRGRSSDALHAHILEVDNTSVYEHCVFTVRMGGFDPEIFACYLINRPGVWAEINDGAVEVTLNHRSVLEWDYWQTSFSNRYSYSGKEIGAAIREHARTLAPRLYPSQGPVFHPNVVCEPKTENLNDHQAWVSLYLAMSRGASQEQCRHGDETAISMRSTRFVDEDGSPYVDHTLLTFYLETCDDDEEKARVRELIRQSKEADGNAYRGVNDALSHFLKDRGVNGTNARKQARGTARGYLGNALFTDMIFSASAFQWKWMLNQRGSVFSDGEIRQLYAPGVLTELQKSRYGHFFSDLELAPSPDGIGQVVVGWEED